MQKFEGYLENQGLILREGTIVDATIINAPSSTKNKDKKRDPEMSSTKKGNQWYFGMKAHVGTDTKRGIVHTVVCTTASVHDTEAMEELLHGDEKSIYGDKAYVSAERQKRFEEQGIAWNITRKAKRGTQLSKKDEKWNKRVSKIRAKGEHPFRILKHLWGYTKTRYKGIAKNAAQIFMLFSLSNIYMLRHDIIEMQR